MGFGTGSESGASMKIEVFDLCRTESSIRVLQGELYPSSTVTGINTDQSGIVNNPGDGNTIAFTFSEGISDSTDIYTDNGGNTATVEFCVQVGLYHSGSLINFAETKLTYNVDLTTSITSLTGYTVTEAEAFTDAADEAITFDGTLSAYFCNPGSLAEIFEGTPKHQGSIFSVCFKVPDGQFEVKDVIDLTMKDITYAEPTQAIVSNTFVNSPAYAEKTCYDDGVHDTNVCVVSFLLTADFFDNGLLTLSGTGSVLLEFGDAAATRRRTRRLLRTVPVRLRRLGEKERSFTVKAQEFPIEKKKIPVKQNDGRLVSKGSLLLAGTVGIVVLCVATVLRIWLRLQAKRKKKQLKLHYQLQQKLHEKEECYDFSVREDDKLFHGYSLSGPAHKEDGHTETTDALFPESSAFSALGASLAAQHSDDAVLTSKLLDGPCDKASNNDDILAKEKADRVDMRKKRKEQARRRVQQEKQEMDTTLKTAQDETESEIDQSAGTDRRASF